MAIDNETKKTFLEVFGKSCCRKRVGRDRSLSMGFGKKIPHGKSKLIDSFYGEWEIGSYSAAWRVMRDNKILCGSMTAVESIEELNVQLQKIDFGVIFQIEELSSFDIRVSFDCGAYIDFMCASIDDDEMFHVFGPDYTFVEYKFPSLWKTGKSNIPWS